MDKKKKRIIFFAVKIAAAALVSAAVIGLCAPFYFVIIRAFSPAKEMFPMKFFPSEFTAQNFAALFYGVGESGVPFSRNLFSSFFIAVITTAVQIPVVCAAGYVLAKVKAPGIRALDRVLEWSLVLSPLSLYVVQYLMMLKIGVSDTYPAMMLLFVASPLAVFLVKKYMRVIPDEVICCARLDGASHFRICFGIVMPNIKPAIFAAAVLSFGEMWKYSGELFAKSAGIKPFSALLKEFSASEEFVGIFCAAVAVIAIPAAVLALVFRKELVKTLSCAGISPN